MRILVADDHSLFRDGLVSLLEAAGFDVVGQVGDGEAAVEAALRLRPEAILLDVTMPRLNGLGALRHIREQWAEAQVVMLTASDDDQTLYEAAEAGAHGFLHKNLNADEFVELLNGLERGEAAMTRQTMTRLMNRLGTHLNGGPARPAPIASPMESLTQREADLLELMVKGASNKEMAQTLGLSENTIKYHVKHILQKLGVQNRTEAAVLALKHGWLKQPIDVN